MTFFCTNQKEKKSERTRTRDKIFRFKFVFLNPNGRKKKAEDVRKRNKNSCVISLFKWLLLRCNSFQSNAESYRSRCSDVRAVKETDLKSVGQCPRRFKSCSERCYSFFFTRSCGKNEGACAYIVCIAYYVKTMMTTPLRRVARLWYLLLFFLLWTTLQKRAQNIIDAKARRSTGNSSCRFSLLNLCCIFDTTWYPDHDHRRHRSRRRTRSDAVAITKRWWCYY